MENPILLKILIPQQSRQLPGEPVDHRQVQGPKVLVEGKVRQIVVDVEKESIFVVLGWLGVGDPKEFFYKVKQKEMRNCPQK